MAESGNKKQKDHGGRSGRKRSRVRRSGPAMREKSAWDKLPVWAHHAICISFLFVVALAFYWPALSGGTLAGGDTINWRANAEAMIQAEEATGEKVLWAPNVFGGMPGYMVNYGNAVPGADDIPRLIRRIGFWPTGFAFVMLLGMYFLVVFLTRSELAATVSAIAYGLTTYFPILLAAGHNTKFIALAYAPWLLLAFAAVLRRREGNAMWAAFLTLLFAIAAAINLRAGHVQITYYLVFIAAIWWVAEGIAAIREGKVKHFAISTGLLVVGAVLALAMVAQPYLSQWEYKAFTIRGSGEGGGLGWDYAMAWSQGIGEMLTLLIPNAFGGSGATYWGPKPFTVGPHYLGGTVIVLALIGAAGVVRRSVYAFAVAAVLMMGFALGSHFEALSRLAFRVLPLFDSFRAPETWMAAVAFALSVLAGWGAYKLARREATEEGEARKRRIAYGSLGAVGGLLVLLFLVGGSLLDFEKPGEQHMVQEQVAQMQQQAAQMGLPQDDPRVTQAIDQVRRQVEQAPLDRAELFRSDALRAILLLAVSGALIVLLLMRKTRSWVALAGLALVVTVDLWGVDRRYFNEDIDAIRSRSRVEASIPLSDGDRFVAAKQDSAGGAGHFRVLPWNPTQNAIPSYVVESVGGYHGAKLAVIQTWYDDILPDDTAHYNARALDLLSIRYAMAPGLIPGLEPVYQDPQTSLLVLENSDHLPRAFFADSFVVVEDEGQTIRMLREPEVDLQTTVLLREEPPAEISEHRGQPDTSLAFTEAEGDTSQVLVQPDSVLSESPGTRVVLQRHTPDEIVWRVETDRPRLLVASEIYYPAGWKALVGREEVPIYQANHLLRAVPVPEGEHIVSVRFEPASHRRGVLISLIASLLVYFGVVVLGGLLWYKRGESA